MLTSKALIGVFLALTLSQAVLGQSCEQDSDCTDGKICSFTGKTCVECDFDSDCAAPLPACANSGSATPDVCVECQYDSHCSGRAAPAICADDDTCQTVECAQDSDCEEGLLCASSFSQNNPNKCVGCEWDADCEGENEVCTEAGECKDPSTVEVRCLQTQVSITGGMCAGQHTLRLCGETQKQADDKGANIAEEMSKMTVSVCADDIDDMCKQVGGSAKSEGECPSSCEALFNDEELQCQDDSTCEMDKYGSASTRSCCPTMDQVKSEVKRQCSSVDNDRLEALASVGLALSSSLSSCYEDDCVQAASSPAPRSLDFKSLAAFAALSVFVSAGAWRS